eukprot:gene23770-biopygen4357
MALEWRCRPVGSPTARPVGSPIAAAGSPTGDPKLSARIGQGEEPGGNVEKCGAAGAVPGVFWGSVQKCGKCGAAGAARRKIWGNGKVCRRRRRQGERIYSRMHAYPRHSIAGVGLPANTVDNTPEFMLQAQTWESPYFMGESQARLGELPIDKTGGTAGTTTMVVVLGESHQWRLSPREKRLGARPGR